ncbi:MAG: hypothetical protein V4671_12835 [Armatimonadota bacterium]
MNRRTTIIIAILPLIGLAIQYSLHVEHLRREQIRRGQQAESASSTAYAAMMSPADGRDQRALRAAQRRVMGQIKSYPHATAGSILPS